MGYKTVQARVGIMQKRWVVKVLALSISGSTLPVFAVDMAQVVFVSGGVQLERSAQSTDLSQGSNVAVGDVIRTSAKGHVYLKTVDNGFISLRPDSELRVDVYDFDPAQPAQARIKLTLIKGTLRSVSGEGAQAAKHQYRLNTPVAAIGVRGTDYTAVTTATQTLASVQQGGIAVAPLSEQCLAASFGPCAQGVLDLYASDAGKVLQVTPGQVQSLLKNERNNPDSLNAPLAPENSKAAPVQSKATDDAVVLAQAVRQKETIIAPAVAVNAPSQFDWGRWSALAQLPANTDYSQMQAKGQVVALNQHYFLAQNTPLTQLPQAGKYGFALAQAEAYFIQQGVATAATVNDAKLTIDFAQKRFDTSLALASANQQTTISASGGLLANGSLGADRVYESPNRSPIQLEGSVAGAGATQAAYVFYQQLEPGLQVSGATRWAR